MGIYFDVPLTVGDWPGCGVGFYFHGSPVLLADKTFAEEPLARWRPDLSLQVNPDGRLLISRQKSDDTYLVLATLHGKGHECDEEIVTTRTGIESIKVLYYAPGIRGCEGVYDVAVLKVCRGDMLCVTDYSRRRVVYIVADDGSVFVESRPDRMSEWRHSPYLNKLSTEDDSVLWPILSE